MVKRVNTDAADNGLKEPTSSAGRTKSPGIISKSEESHSQMKGTRWERSRFKTQGEPKSEEGSRGCDSGRDSLRK